MPQFVVEQGLFLESPQTDCPVEKYNIPEREYDAEILIASKALSDIIAEIASVSDRIQIEINVDNEGDYHKLKFIGNSDALKSKIELGRFGHSGTDIDISVRSGAAGTDNYY